MSKASREQPLERRTRACVRGLIGDELTDPAAMPELRRRLAEQLEPLAPLLELLEAKDEERRATFFVRAASAWHRRFGFRLMRPLLVLGVGAAIVFSVQRWIDPTVGVGLFLLGAFAFYVLLQVFLFRWAREDERSLGRIREDYRRKLEALRASLDAPAHPDE